MSESRRRREEADPIVRHYTSHLWTAQIWTDGRIRVEGDRPDPMHPELDLTAFHDPRHARPIRDFGPVAWLTTQPGVPPTCRILTMPVQQGRLPGRHILGPPYSDAVSLKRISLGFRASAIGAVRWSAHPGYNTEEGRDLTKRAIDLGDDPAQWWVCDQDVEVEKIIECRQAESIENPRMQPFDEYIVGIKRLVGMAKIPNSWIAPTWMPLDVAREAAKNAGIKIASNLGSTH